LPVTVIRGFAGNASTITSIGIERALSHPLALVTLTVNTPAAVTSILRVLAPLDHKYVLASEAVSTTLSPSQKVVLPLAVTTGVIGRSVTVTFILSEAALSQEAALTVVSQYSPLSPTVMLLVVAPVDHL
jgi:hypothetical protein